MTNNKMGILALTAAVFAGACADPSGPGVSRTFDSGPFAAVTDAVRGVNGYAFPAGMVSGDVRVCKTVPAGDPTIQFSFAVTATGVVGGALGPTTTNHNITATAGATTCAIVFHSTKSGTGLDSVRIVESAPPANWALTAINTLRIDDGPNYTPPNSGAISGDVVVENVAARSVSLYINVDMGRIVTFTNDYTAPDPTGCTYTKGWYRNNGSSTVIAVDGRTVAQAQAIFDATPGKPGSVTFGGDNTLLNLYQQFLAALNNLGGDANEDNGPLAVDIAIDAVQAGTGGSGLAITTTLTHEQMSGYIETLSAFNEGTLAGWPHCDD